MGHLWCFVFIWVLSFHCKKKTLWSPLLSYSFLLSQFFFFFNFESYLLFLSLLIHAKWNQEWNLASLSELPLSHHSKSKEKQNHTTNHAQFGINKNIPTWMFFLPYFRRRRTIIRGFWRSTNCPSMAYGTTLSCLTGCTTQLTWTLKDWPQHSTLALLTADWVHNEMRIKNVGNKPRNHSNGDNLLFSSHTAGNREETDWMPSE